MADSNDFHDEGFARELAVAQRLEDYLANCLWRIEPPVAIRCVLDSRGAKAEICCNVEVDREVIKAAEASLKTELRPISEGHDAAAATIEWEAVIPAIVKMEQDHANQVFRILLRAIEVTEPTNERAILQLPTKHAPDPNYGLPASEIEHVIVLIHGIRDIGAWQKKVSSHLENQGTVVKQIRFGLYPAIRFLFPLDLSGGPIKRVLAGLQALRAQYQNARFSIIAHSFGTYVFLRALKVDPHHKFWKVIFCGSVADDLFRWSVHQHRIGDGKRQTSDFILNDCGTGDVWPVLGAAFGWHYGMAGSTGFSEEYVRNRFHRATGGAKGGHGLYFNPEFVKENWRPFLIDDVAPKEGNGEQGEHLPWLVRCLYHGWVRAICRIVALLIWLSICAGVLWAGWYLALMTFSWGSDKFSSEKPRELTTPTSPSNIEVQLNELRLRSEIQTLRSFILEWRFSDVPEEFRNRVDNGLKKAEEAMLEYQDLEDINPSFNRGEACQAFERFYSLYPWMNVLATGMWGTEPVLLIADFDSSITFPLGRLNYSVEAAAAGLGIELYENLDIRELPERTRKGPCDFGGTIFKREGGIVMVWNVGPKGLRQVLDTIPEMGDINAVFPEQLTVSIFGMIEELPVDLANTTNRDHWFGPISRIKKLDGGFTPGTSTLNIAPNDGTYTAVYEMTFMGRWPLDSDGNAIGGGNTLTPLPHTRRCVKAEWLGKRIK